MSSLLLVASALSQPLMRAHLDRARAVVPAVRYLQRLDRDTPPGGANTIQWTVDGRHVLCSLTRLNGTGLLVSLRRTDLKPWVLVRGGNLDTPGKALSASELQSAAERWRQAIYPEVKNWRPTKHSFDSGDHGRRFFLDVAAPSEWREGQPEQTKVKLDVVRGSLYSIAFKWPDELEYFKRPIEPRYNLPSLGKDLAAPPP